MAGADKQRMRGSTDRSSSRRSTRTILVIIALVSSVLPMRVVEAQTSKNTNALVADGATITVSTAPDQNALVVFDAPKAGARYILYWTSHYPSPGGVIFKPPCGWICASDFGDPDVPHHAEFEAGDAGRNVIRIDPADSVAGSMDLKLASIPDDVVVPIEPDGETLAVETKRRGQNIQLVFESPEANQRYILYWTSHYYPDPGALVAGGAIFYPGCGWTCASDFGEREISHHHEFAAPDKGRNTIVLDPWQFATGSIDVKLASIPQDVVVPIEADGAAVTVTTERRGQNAQLVFDSPSAGKRYQLQWTSYYPVDYSALVAGGVIFYPGCGWTCASDFSGPGDPRQSEFNAPEAGRNVIVLDPWQFATGCIEVRLVTVSVDGVPTQPNDKDVSGRCAAAANPSGRFRIEMRTFIPQDHVSSLGKGSFGCFRKMYFEGDDRGFDSDGGRYRTQQVLSVVGNHVLDSDGYVEGSYEARAGTTRLFASNALAGDDEITEADIDATLGDCHLLHDERALCTDCNGSDAFSKTVQRIDDFGGPPNLVSVSLRADAGNPLFPLACAVNYELDLSIVDPGDGSPPRWGLAIEHDGFPAYELYVNDKLIYSHHPGGGSAPSIFRLCGREEVTGNYSGTL
jgi:hypothetical protein